MANIRPACTTNLRHHVSVRPIKAIGFVEHCCPTRMVAHGSANPGCRQSCVLRQPAQAFGLHCLSKSCRLAPAKKQTHGLASQQSVCCHSFTGWYARMTVGLNDILRHGCNYRDRLNSMLTPEVLAVPLSAGLECRVTLYNGSAYCIAKSDLSRTTRRATSERD